MFETLKEFFTQTELEKQIDKSAEETEVGFRKKCILLKSLPEVLELLLCLSHEDKQTNLETVKKILKSFKNMVSPSQPDEDSEENEDEKNFEKREVREVKGFPIKDSDQAGFKKFQEGELSWLESLEKAKLLHGALVKKYNRKKFLL